MSLQFIADSSGKTTGVFIPIEEWNELKNKFKGIQKEEDEIPEWHKNLLSERLEEYRKNPDQVVDFETAIREIEDDL